MAPRTSEADFGDEHLLNLEFMKTPSYYQASPYTFWQRNGSSEARFKANALQRHFEDLHREQQYPFQLVPQNGLRNEHK